MTRFSNYLVVALDELEKCDGIMTGSKDVTEDDRVCSKNATNGFDNQISDRMSRHSEFENV